MRFWISFLPFLIPSLAWGQAWEDEEYTTPESYREYHSNLGQQRIVKTNRQKEFNFVGQEPNEILPGSIPLGSLREWSKKVKVSTENKPTPYPAVPVSKGLEKRGVHPSRKIKGWVGSLPSEILPGGIPLGSLQTRRFEFLDPGVSQDTSVPSSSGEDREFPLQLGLMAGLRPYYTSNVLRLNDNETGSGVLETSAGFSISSKPQKVGRYLSLVPRLDFMMQWANYQDNSVKDLLNYRFGMVKGGLDFRFPREWSINLGLEYDFLHSQSTGDRMFDAVVPSLGIQKIFALGDTTFLLLNGGIRYSLTDKDIPFPVEGVFADDGDNLQTSAGLSLIQTFLDRNQLVLSPSIGISNTHYLRNLHDGRNDLVFFAGISGIWQVTDFFALQLFLNYSTMSTNAKGDSLLGPSSSFQAVDTGGSINLNFSF
jgi:hypothetical protein